MHFSSTLSFLFTILLFLICFTHVAHSTTSTVVAIPTINVLITGFGPFLNYTTNPSQLVASQLGGNCFIVSPSSSSFKVCFNSTILSVDTTGSTTVSNYLASFNNATASDIPFDLILHLGLEDVAAGLKLETIALNQLASASPATQPIVPNGPQLLPSTIDLSHIRISDLYSSVQAKLELDSLVKDTVVRSSSSKIKNNNNNSNNNEETISMTRYTADDSETWSRDAGTYYCNETLYRTLFAIRSLNLRRSISRSLLLATFVHLPNLNVMTVDVMASLVVEYVGQLAIPLALQQQ